jgi:hypothetical protein
MDEVRGHFKIKRSRLPLLSREYVIAYSSLSRIPSRRRTTIEYRENPTGNFVRSYLPSSVEYLHVDPLCYVTLLNIFCGEEGQLPSTSGCFALFFGVGVSGNGLPLSTAEKSISLSFRNGGDVQVRVFATMFGLASG